MIRHLKIARDTAVKGRTQALLTVKALLVTAPASLREQLDGIIRFPSEGLERSIARQFQLYRGHHSKRVLAEI
jgi:hypothetical protein